MSQRGTTRDGGPVAPPPGPCAVSSLPVSAPCMSLDFAIEIEREDDGRWIAEVPGLPGVMAYGVTEQAAIAGAEALALRVLADRLEQGEAEVSLTITFAPADA